LAPSFAEDTLKDGDLIMSRKLLMLAAAALLPLFSAQAAETPKEGTDKKHRHGSSHESKSDIDATRRHLVIA
jgi:hypothetical protein